MDQDQLIKQVEWLDKERREDKKSIAALQKKVAELEGLLDKSNNAIRESKSEITRLNVLVAKVDQFEGVMGEHRVGVKKEIDAQEKRAKQREVTVKKSLTSDLDQLRTNLAEFKHELDKIGKLSQQILDNKEDDNRRDRLIGELQKQISDLHPPIEENTDAIRSLQDDKIPVEKKIADVAGEVSALRTKQDELRGKQELITESQRKIDAKVSEISASEEDRRSNQMAYLDKLSLENESREKTWQKWEKRFSDIEDQADAMSRSLESYTEAERAVQKAQKELEKITEQINRRIHEITEMQRLGEERFRQEWNTFKADDQKRWANYALTQDELAKETTRRFERIDERATNLEEITQDLQDTVQHTGEQFEKLMQGILASMRDWLATTERYTDSVG